MKTLILALICISILLTGCYEGQGYAYEHLNNQNPGGLRTQDPGRIEVSPGEETIGGAYEALNNNLCELNPPCCGDFDPEDTYYQELQERAIAEQNPEICAALPRAAYILDCPGEEPVEIYNQETCYHEARR